MISDFAKEKVFWTRKMNLKLVKFIESRPNIWNPKHPKYTSVAARDQTYAEFATKYGNEFSWQAVKDRWTNIRSTFANYLRKFNASRVKGDGEVYKVNWHLWEACSFLLKVNKKSKKAEITTSDKYNNQDDTKDLAMNCQDLSFDEDHSIDSTTACVNIADNLLTVFRGVQNDAFGVDNTKHGQIGSLITKKLTQMSSYDAAQISNKVMQILLLYNENNPLNPNNLKSECI